MAAAELFSSELSVLRELEGFLFAKSASYRPQEIDKINKSLADLKECIYFFRSREGASNLRNDFRYQKLIGEFSPLVKKMAHAVQHPTASAAVLSLTEEVVTFHGELLELPEASTSLSSSETKVAELRHQLAAYERKSQEYKVELKSLREQMQAAKNVVSSVVETKTAKEWTEEYVPYITLDDSIEKLRQKVEAQNPKSWRGRVAKKWKMRMLTIRRLFVSVVFYGGKSYASTARKWRFWRGFYLFCLFGLSVAYIAVFWNFDITSKGIADFLAEKSIFLPLLVVIWLGFTFSSKNHRITSNLLEQYKHRYVVAKTLQNLMLLDDLKQDAGVKSELIQQGAGVLFEFRNSGYMAKGKEQFGLTEILELFKKEA